MKCTAMFIFTINWMFIICFSYYNVTWLHTHKSISTMPFKSYHSIDFTKDETDQHHTGNECSLVEKMLNRPQLLK